MVWIHGGGFERGSGHSPVFDGASFARNHGVVVVTLNYRLGPLGFLYLEELGGPGYRGSGNAGILDQVAALRWVRENIAGFGGDPNRVTVFGQSAGAGSVAILLAMPEARGLFRGAILQSGAAYLIHDAATATAHAESFLGELGVRRADLDRLYDLPVEALLEAGQRFKRLRGLRWGPVVDGTSLPLHPLVGVEGGSARDVEVLIGTNLHEMRYMRLTDPEFVHQVEQEEDESRVMALFADRFGPVPDSVVRYYTRDPRFGATIVDRYIHLLGDQRFLIPAIELAERQLAAGGRVWMYRFDWQSRGGDGRLGACHSLEVPFVWNTVHVEKARELTGDGEYREVLATQMHAAWASFARQGTPECDPLPKWPTYDLDHRPTMVFDDHSHVEWDPARDIRSLWKPYVDTPIKG